MNENMEFLNKDEQPTEEMVYKAFNLTIAEAKKYNAHIPLETIISLEEPTSIEVIKGDVWSLTKLLWDTPHGQYMRLEIVRNGHELDEEIEDIDFEDVSDEYDAGFELDYDTKLSFALVNEDYDEAIHLREWMRGYRLFLEKVKPLMKEALVKEDFILLNEYMISIKDFYKTI